MLIHASPRSGTANTIEGDAHIVISLDAEGSSARVRAYRRGEWDSSYATKPAEAMPAEIAKLIAELQAQIAVPHHDPDAAGLSVAVATARLDKDRAGDEVISGAGSVSPSVATEARLRTKQTEEEAARARAVDAAGCSCLRSTLAQYESLSDRLTIDPQHVAALPSLAPR